MVLRIAMLGHKRMPSREGGIEVVVGELSIRMAAKGHDVTCYNRKGSHISGKEYTLFYGNEYKGVHIKQVFCINRRGWAAMTSSIIAAIHAALGKYDVVHFHAEGPCAMLWLPKLLGKRCIVTVHGLDHKREKWGKLAMNYIMTGEKVAVKWADEIIVLTRSMQQYFKNVYGRDTVVIPNGVNRPVCKSVNLINKIYQLEKEDYILFLGRLTPEKRIDCLIQAYKKTKIPKKLVIAGGASDTERYAKELKELAKGDTRIIFTGFVQGEILEELYSNAYLFVQPSDLEGMPLSLLEAMSYGNCCLVSDIPEHIESVGDCCVKFQKGNVEDLSKRLEALCKNTEQVNFYKDKSADFICERFNWDKVTESTLELYKKGIKK